MKKLHALVMATVALLAAPVASFAQNGHWTSVASAGTTIDEADLGIYAVDGGDLFFAPNMTGTIHARYNVVNTANPNGEMPMWNTFEIGYDDIGLGVVKARLWKVDPCTGVQLTLCQITSANEGMGWCKTCQFPAPLNFVNQLYFVAVEVTRNSVEANPILHTLRIYGD
jgi:hypothetical protein